MPPPVLGEEAPPEGAGRPRDPGACSFRPIEGSRQSSFAAPSPAAQESLLGRAWQRLGRLCCREERTVTLVVSGELVASLENDVPAVVCVFFSTEVMKL
jgi:hypothetical protein